ncbi:response regulator [Micromonospora terminaliae]|uniref:Response regulator n=1 Tax=Micromonospora terminaliae TaxID=1914461 RepID=A0AAJ2ZDY1_9ACTN|nr:response regulator transcription factor [Micromonospora terminaliae]QGL51310.1 response regulator [Micromonospora terminaliae]
MRVLIADDHPVFRAGLTGVLEDAPDIEVLAAAEHGADALDLAVRLRPDVVLMDLHMPVVNGVEATRRLVAAAPEVAVLVLTMFDDDESVIAALRAGARGYVVKGADGDRIVGAIRAVAAGEALFGSGIAAGVLRVLAAHRRGDRPGRPFPMLTDREREVLDLIAAGLGNREIARRLNLSDKTVRNHVTNIFAKLRVADRAQAIIRARQAGLGLVDGS